MNGWSDKSEQEHRIEFRNGGCVTVRSADNPDSLRGEGLDGVVIDEAAFLSEACWREALRPALADKQGWCMMISTPNGYNWFKDLFDQAATDGAWARWQRPSSENPLIPADELEQAMRDMGLRAFAQEHLAQFTDVEGAEFSGAYFHDGVWFDNWPHSDTIRMRVMALDPSKGKTDKSDYSAFVMIALDFDGVMWIDADLSRRDTRQIVDDGLLLCRGFGPDAFGIEINQFQEVLAQNFEEVSKKTGLMLPLHGIHNTEHKTTRIRATLTPYLARGEMRFRRTQGGKLLVDQLRSFPLDKYDDGPDALEMGVRLVRWLFTGGHIETKGELVRA